MNTATQIKSTQATKVVAVHNKQVAEICSLLNWSTDQYYQFQYEQYEAFLKRAFYGQREIECKIVRYSPLMRGLWNNEWIIRNDNDFIEFARDSMQAQVLVNNIGQLEVIEVDEAVQSSVYDEYIYIHNAQRLYNNFEFMAKYYHVLTLIAKS